MSEPLWINDPAILFSPSTWQKFVPTKDMDVSAALNSVVRFTVYFSILLYATSGKSSYLFSIPVVLITTIVFSKLFPTTRALVETFKVPTLTTNYTMPTQENPFMNPLLTDIMDDPNRPDAAPITKNSVKREIEKAFQQTSELQMDTTDRFDQAQAMRNFATLQNGTIPSDQDGFLKFLAKGIDEPDFSSAPPARNAKKDSESYVEARGSMKDLTSTTSKPTGTAPRHAKAS